MDSTLVENKKPSTKNKTVSGQKLASNFSPPLLITPSSSDLITSSNDSKLLKSTTKERLVHSTDQSDEISNTQNVLKSSPPRSRIATGLANKKSPKRRRYANSSPQDSPPPQRPERSSAEDDFLETSQMTAPTDTNSSSLLIGLPYEVLLAVLINLDIRSLIKIGGICVYLNQIVQEVWKIRTKQRYPFITDKEWSRLSHRQSGTTSELLYSTLYSLSKSSSKSLPPTQTWQFLYFHATLAQNRNFLSSPTPKWTVNFTSSKPIRVPSQNARDALVHQYHLFPTCITIDDDLVICGSGVYETVGDPTTMMIGNRIIQVWNAKTGSLSKTISAHPSAILDITCDSQHIYSSSMDRTIAIWDKSTGANITTVHGHLKAVYCLQIYEDFLVSGGKDKTIRIWRRSTLTQSEQSSSSQNVGNTTDNPIRQVQVYYGRQNDGKILIPPAGTRIDAGTHGLVSVFYSHEHSVRTFQAVDGVILSGSGGGQISLRDIETGTLIHTSKIAQEISHLRFDGNNATIATDNNLAHFDTRTFKIVREAKDSSRQVYFDSSKMLTSDSKGSIKVWDWTMFSEISSFRAHKQRTCFAYDKKSDYLFTAGGDKVVKKYDFSHRPASPSSSPSTEKKCSLM